MGYVTGTDLGKWLGVHPDTISDDVTELDTRGMVDVEEQGQGLPNRYHVNWTLKKPKAKYVPTLDERKQKAAKEAKRKERLAASLAKQEADAVEKLLRSIEEAADDDVDIVELAKDVAVYWFQSIGDMVWPIRNPQQVVHQENLLVILLAEIPAEAMKAIIDNHIAAHGDTSIPCT
ncbi:hypothetical protein [Microbispora bryophytorum]|uniref:Uncharacterized protein n=1 Tax=Microbispora bryophytorum subsp. camponoti TaxID=1677852 RepID=A0ABR8L847_9ACTN|nr:hypothetical protein [Microbispora camponoti]MBD3147096.1 hypothetical protein [Microbispora camponoti]